MELVVLGQREFAGIIDEVPGFARKMLAGMAQAAPRSRRPLGSVARSQPGSVRGSTPGVDSSRDAQAAIRIRSSSVSASPSAVFTIASRHRARDHALARRLADRARGLHQRPDRAEGRVLRARSRRCCSSSRGSRRCGSATTSAAPPDDRRTTQQERQAARSTTSAPACGCRRCCATPPPGSCTRASTSGSSSLFIVDGAARDRPPAARVAEVPARPRRTRRTRSAPTSRASCSSSASAGRSCAATSSARTASASRPSPKTR